MASSAPSSARQVKLERECELRIEVGENSPLRLRLLSGTAEIFGTEIPPEIWLNFPPRLKFAVLSSFNLFRFCSLLLVLVLISHIYLELDFLN